MSLFILYLDEKMITNWLKEEENLHEAKSKGNIYVFQLNTISYFSCMNISCLSFLHFLFPSNVFCYFIPFRLRIFLG